MNEIHEPVSVILIYDCKKKKATPYKIKWRNRDYLVEEVCMHQIHNKEGIPHHNYSVRCGNTTLAISMNTQTLAWELEALSDCY